MRRAVGIIVVLTAVLGGLLYWKLSKQRMDAMRPAGGSATVEGLEVDVMARLAARVKRVNVSEGEAVKKGQLLVELDCREYVAMYAQADAQLKTLEAGAEAAGFAVKTAGRQVGLAWTMAKAARAARKAAEIEKAAAKRAETRMKKLHGAGAVSDQNLDISATRVDGLSLKVRAAKTQLRAARVRTGVAAAGKAAARAQHLMAIKQIEVARAAVQRAVLAVGECKLTAPRSGYVLIRSVEPGEVVMPGSRVITIGDISEVKATFYIPNAELSAVRPGRKVEVRADAFPKKVFFGKIIRVGKEAEFTPRNVQTRDDRDRLVYSVEVQLPNPKGLLRPGMPVEVSVPGTGGKKKRGR
jgi:HlyD family secretion protein